MRVDDDAMSEPDQEREEDNGDDDEEKEQDIPTTVLQDKDGHGEELEPSQEEIESIFLPIDSFIRSSRAFDLMIMRLKDMAYPTFKSQVTENSTRLLRSKLAQTWPNEYRDNIRSAMAVAISEIHFSRPKGVLTENHNELSTVEKIQRQLESATGEQWDWWPLCPPRPLIKAGESRLGWICVSAVFQQFLDPDLV